MNIDLDMSTATASAASMAGGSSTPPQSLIKFCLLWTVLHRSTPPEVCNSVADYHQSDFNKVFFNQQELLNRLKLNSHHHPQTNDILDSNSNSKTAIDTTRDNAIQFHFKHSSRSLSVIGVLGGIVLILFFVALSTCIKHRRNVNAFGDRYHHRENLAREMLVDHIRQLRSNYRGDGNRSNQSDRPPSYEDVVKDPVAGHSNDEVDDPSLTEEPPSYIEATNAASTLNSITTTSPIESQSQPDTSSLTTIVTVETHVATT